MSQVHEMIIIIRPSFKKFCGQDACRAALFNHLLYWIAKKAKSHSIEDVRAGNVYWYGTAEEICKEGLDESWCVNKVRKEIKDLVDSKIIGQRRNPLRGWDQTRHYYFGEEQGQALRELCEKYNICLYHIGLTPEVLHLLNLVNAFTKFSKCNCQKDEMDLPNVADGFTKNGNAIPKDYTKVTTEDYNKEVTSDDLANANHHDTLSPFSSFQEELDAGEYALQVSLMSFLRGHGIDTSQYRQEIEQLSTNSGDVTQVINNGASNDVPPGTVRDTTPHHSVRPLASAPVDTPVVVGGNQEPSQPLATHARNGLTASQPIIPRPETQEPSSTSTGANNGIEHTAATQHIDSSLPQQASGNSYSREDTGNHDSSSQPEPRTNQSVPEQQPAPVQTNQSGRGKQRSVKPEKEMLTDAGRVVLERWRSLFKRPIAENQSNIEAANRFAPCDPSVQDMKDERGWLYATQPKWFGKNGQKRGGVTLKDMADNWEGWVSSQASFEIPDEMKSRVDDVMDCLNTWRQKKTNDPEEMFIRDAEGEEAICKLLQGKPPTKKRLEKVCDEMWNEKPNERTGYNPKKHMTVKSICNRYAGESMSFAVEERQQEKQATPTQPTSQVPLETAIAVAAANLPETPLERNNREMYERFMNQSNKGA